LAIATVVFSAIDSIAQGTLEVKGNANKFYAFFVKNLKKTPNFVKVLTSKKQVVIPCYFYHKVGLFWGVKGEVKLMQGSVAKRKGGEAAASPPLGM